MNLKTWYRTWQAQRARPLPYVSTPYRAALEQAQRRYLVSFMLLLLLVGYYAYYFTQQRASSQALRAVVVAQVPLTYPHKLEAKDLTVWQLPQIQVPASAWEDPADLVGKTLIRSLEPKEVVVALDVQPALAPDSVSAQFSHHQAFTLGEDWLVAKLPDLKRADRVDILATNPKDGLEATVTIAANLDVIAVSSHSGRRTLTLQVNPEQAQALLFTRGLRLPMQVVVHSAIFTTKPVESKSNPVVDEV